MDLNVAYFEIPVHLDLFSRGQFTSSRYSVFDDALGLLQGFHSGFDMVSLVACRLCYLDSWLVIGDFLFHLLQHSQLLQFCKDLEIVINWEKSLGSGFWDVGHHLRDTSVCLSDHQILGQSCTFLGSQSSGQAVAKASKPCGLLRRICFREENDDAFSPVAVYGPLVIIDRQSNHASTPFQDLSGQSQTVSVKGRSNSGSSSSVILAVSLALYRRISD